MHIKIMILGRPSMVSQVSVRRLFNTLGMAMVTADKVTTDMVAAAISGDIKKGARESMLQARENKHVEDERR
jgi:hypothetical protein